MAFNTFCIGINYFKFFLISQNQSSVRLLKNITEGKLADSIKSYNKMNKNIENEDEMAVGVLYI